MKKATATHKVFKSVSVDATQRHAEREKYTGQKGWGGDEAVGVARPRCHHRLLGEPQERQSALAVLLI